jgi:hypothetical protein
MAKAQVPALTRRALYRLLLPLMGLIATGTTLIARPGYAAPAQIAAQPITFEDGEALFTALAWLNWIADEDPEEAKAPMTAVRQALRAQLKTLPAALRAKNRVAYERLLPGLSRYVRNGLFLSASGLYAAPPGLILHLPLAADMGIAAWSLQGISDYHLPPAGLLSEFYTAADLHTFWTQRYQPALAVVTARIVAPAQGAMADTLAFLRMPLTRPVDVHLSLLGTYGIAGQTSYIPWRGHYEIKVNPPISQNADDDAYILRTLQHELTHVVLNTAVVTLSDHLEPKLVAVAKGLGIEATTAPAEVMAQCVELLSIPEGQRDAHVYARKALLFPHFVEQLPAYYASKQSMSDFLPTLFGSYNPERERQRWQAMQLVHNDDAVSRRRGAATDAIHNDKNASTVNTVAALAALTTKDPGNMLGWYWLGVVALRDLKDSRQARQAFSHLPEKDPALAGLPAEYHAWFYYWQGVLAEREGRKGDAINAMHRVLLVTGSHDAAAVNAQKVLARLQAK